MNQAKMISNHRSRCPGGLVAFLLLAGGCGNLVDIDGGAVEATYAPTGEVATFVSQALLLLDGKLDRVNTRVSYADPDADVLNSTWKKLSADGKVAASASPTSNDFKNRLSVFRVPSGEPLMAIQTQLLKNFYLSRDGGLLVVSSSEGGMSEGGGGLGGYVPTLQVFATSSGALLWRTDVTRGGVFALSVDGTRVFGTLLGMSSREPPRLKAWDAVTGAPLFEITMTVGSPRTLVATPDGQHLMSGVLLAPGPAVATNEIGGRGQFGFALFRTSDGALDHTVPQPPGFLYSHHIAISPDGHLWAISTQRDPDIRPRPTVQIWRDGHLQHVFDKQLFSLSFSPDGQTIATVDLDHAVSIYNAADGRHIARREFRGDLF